MEYLELLTLIGLKDNKIGVRLKKPVRNGDMFITGRVTGFKSGLYGGGHSNYKNGVPHSFDSTKRRVLKEPKIQITYDVIRYGKGEISDWVPVDNCDFELLPEN